MDQLEALVRSPQLSDSSQGSVGGFGVGSATSPGLGSGSGFGSGPRFGPGSGWSLPPSSFIIRYLFFK
jgi:hypothetical protein